MPLRFPIGFLFLIGLGCSGNAYQLASVSGHVTLNGKPVVNATVSFLPIGSKGKDPGPGSYGKTDANGRYKLKVVENDKNGAVVGKHRVSISTQSGGDKDGEAPTSETIPAKYNVETTLQFDVPSGGTEKADFPLTAP
jgi:hypothetical protein